MGEMLDRLSKALASDTSRRGALGGLLAGAALTLPWNAEAKNKKKKKRRKKFQPFQQYCADWCGYKFGFSGKEFSNCVNKAKDGQGPCYSPVDQGPGRLCAFQLGCGKGLFCCPLFFPGEKGAPVQTGECCFTPCDLTVNGTSFCNP